LALRPQDVAASPIRGPAGRNHCGGGGTVMKHRSTRELFAHWSAQCGDHHAPRHDDIQPAAMRAALGDVFILSFQSDLGHPFRLAGTRICRLFCRELKDTAFLSLWREQDRGAIGELVSIVGTEHAGAVAGLSSRGGLGEVLSLELLLLPLRNTPSDRPGIIGTLSPAKIPYWFGARAPASLELATFRHLGAAVQAAEPPPLVRKLNARRGDVGLVVLQGGKR